MRTKRINEPASVQCPDCGSQATRLLDGEGGGRYLSALYACNVCKSQFVVGEHPSPAMAARENRPRQSPNKD
jgi:DNA-directed RNA polymerase subunit RPC12/RpoP